MSRLRDERGFTLVELVVTMSIGMVVLLGLFELLDVSAAGSAQVVRRVGAQQRGRVALEQLQRDLRAAVCVMRGQNADGSARFEGPVINDAASGVVPTANALTVDSDLTTSAELAATAVNGFQPQRRTVAYDQATRRILETTQTSTGSGAALAFSSPGTTRVVLDRVTVPAAGLFTYWAYDTSSPPVLRPVAPGTAGVAQVGLTFTVLPADRPGDAASGATFSDAVAFRMPIDFSSTATSAASGPACQA